MSTLEQQAQEWILNGCDAGLYCDTLNDIEDAAAKLCAAFHLHMTRRQSTLTDEEIERMADNSTSWEHVWGSGMGSVSLSPKERDIVRCTLRYARDHFSPAPLSPDHLLTPANDARISSETTPDLISAGEAMRDALNNLLAAEADQTAYEAVERWDAARSKAQPDQQP